MKWTQERFDNLTVKEVCEMSAKDVFGVLKFLDFSKEWTEAQKAVAWKNRVLQRNAGPYWGDTWIEEIDLDKLGDTAYSQCQKCKYAPTDRDAVAEDFSEDEEGNKYDFVIEWYYINLCEKMEEFKYDKDMKVKNPEADVIRNGVKNNTAKCPFFEEKRKK